jgi:chromosome partitioning protein
MFHVKQRGRVGRIVAIANQKGGVGKTTTAVNLSASLAAAEKKVLLVDFDPQANAGSGVGIRAEAGQPTIYEVIIQGLPLKNVRRSTELRCLDFVPSGRALVGAEVELVTEPNRDKRLRAALEPVKEEYDFIVVDCPPSLGLLTVNALGAADTVLIPIQCEYYALEGLTQLLNTVRLVQRGLNPGLGIEGVLLTMFDSRLNLSKQVAGEARRYFPEKVYETVIPRNVRLSEAPSFGRPILLYDVSSLGSKSYLRLAKEVIESGKAGVRQGAGSPTAG